MTVAALAVALALAASPADYLEGRQLPSGAFAEPGGRPSAALTSWAVLGLRASGRQPSAATRRYLASAETVTVGELALALLARGAVEPNVDASRLWRFERPNGAIGSTTNSTIWAVLAYRQNASRIPPRTRQYLLREQTRTGGWGWAPGVAPDSNDTAAAVQALRSLDVGGRPIRRALAFLRAHQNRDGGFSLLRGRTSDTQSTAWSIQAFVAARATVPRGAFAYLARMRRADGSYRYSTRYAVTPVWVTAQVMPALARTPFPLRRP